MVSLGVLVGADNVGLRRTIVIKGVYVARSKVSGRFVCLKWAGRCPHGRRSSHRCTVLHNFYGKSGQLC